MSAEHSTQMFLLQLFVLVKSEVKCKIQTAKRCKKNPPFLMDPDQPSIQWVMTIFCWSKAVVSAILCQDEEGMVLYHHLAIHLHGVMLQSAHAQLNILPHYVSFISQQMGQSIVKYKESSLSSWLLSHISTNTNWEVMIQSKSIT
jgi:hypothetical protein